MTVASRRILFWNQGDLERKLENYKAYTINAGVTPGWLELRRLNGVAYPHGQSQTLNHTPGGTIAMVHFRHYLLHELEFDTDRAEISGSEPPNLSVLRFESRRAAPRNRSLPRGYGSALILGDYAEVLSSRAIWPGASVSLPWMLDSNNARVAGESHLFDRALHISWSIKCHRASLYAFARSSIRKRLWIMKG